MLNEVVKITFTSDSGTKVKVTPYLRRATPAKKYFNQFKLQYYLNKLKILKCMRAIKNNIF